VQTLLKRTYLMTVIYGEFCLRMDAVHRLEHTRFDRHASVEWDYGQL